MNESQLSNLTHKSNLDMSGARLMSASKNSSSVYRRLSDNSLIKLEQDSSYRKPFCTDIITPKRKMTVTPELFKEISIKESSKVKPRARKSAMPSIKTIKNKTLVWNIVKKPKKDEENLVEQSKKNVVNRNLRRVSKNIKFFIHNIIGKIGKTGKLENGKEKEFIAQVLAPKQIYSTSEERKRSLSTFNLNSISKIRSASVNEKQFRKTYSSIENPRPKSLEDKNIHKNLSIDKIIETNESRKTAKKYRSLREEISSNINRADTDEDAKLEVRKFKSFQNVYDSFSDEEYQSDEKEHECVIDNSSIYKQIWNFLLLFSVLYSCTVEPFLLTFGTEKDELLPLEMIIDVLFIADIILNFFTPYYHLDEILIRNPRKIVMHYLTTWFFFDLVTSLPTSFISVSPLELSNSAKGLIKISRIYRVSKWLRIFRLAKVAKNDSNSKFLSDIKINEDNGIDRVLKFLLFFCILTHIAACIWIFIGKEVEEVYNGISWISHYKLSDAPMMDVYLTSVYFNLVTIFTIGYGDITSHNTIERIYNIFYMLVGVLLFSFTISSLSTIFSKISEDKKNLRKKFDLLDELNREFDIPTDLYHKIKKTVKFQQKKVSIEKFELLDTLPFALKKEVILSMNRKGISHITLFKDQDRDFVIYVLPLLRSLQINRSDTLIAIGDYVEEMYIVLKGVLSVRMEKYYSHLEIAQIRANCHFGEVFMYLNENCPYLIDCKSEKCDLLMLKKEDYTKIILAFNENILMILKNSCQFLENIEKTRKVVLELYAQGESLKKIKNHLKKLNSFLLKRQFDGFFHYELIIEEAEDFILNHEVEDIVKFLKTSMTEKDFVDCFLKEKINKRLTRVNSSDSDSTSSITSKDTKRLGNSIKFSLANVSKQRLNSIVEFSEDSNNSSSSNSSSNNSKENKNNSINTVNHPEKIRKFSQMLENDAIMKKRRITHDLGQGNMKLGLIQEETDLNNKMKNMLVNSQKGVCGYNKKGCKTNNFIGRSSVFVGQSNTKSSPLISTILTSKQRNSIQKGIHYPQVNKHPSVNFDFSRGSIFSGVSSASISDNPSSEFKIVNLYNYENNYNQNYYVNNNKHLDFEISSSCNVEILGKEEIKTKAPIKFEISNLSVCTNYNLSYSDNQFNGNYSKNNSLFGTILYKAKNSRTNIVDDILKTKKKFPTVGAESQSISINTHSPPKILEKNRLSGKNQNSFFFEEIPKRCGSSQKLTTVFKPETVISQDSANTTKNNFMTNLNTFLNSQNNYITEIPHIHDRSQSISPKSKFNNSYSKLKKKKLNNSNSIGKLNNSNYNYNSYISANASPIQLKSLPGNNKRSALINKDNLFNKVSNGIQLDEIFHLDKFYLMNNINNFIQEREEYTKVAATCLRKLDRMINNLNLNNKHPKGKK